MFNMPETFTVQTKSKLKKFKIKEKSVFWKLTCKELKKSTNMDLKVTLHLCFLQVLKN